MLIEKAFADKSRSKSFFLLSVFFSIVFIVTVQVTNYSNREDRVSEKFQKNLLKQLYQLDNQSAKLARVFDKDGNDYWPKLERIVNQENTLCLIYKMDSLIFWNNNRISEDVLETGLRNPQVAFTNNGWYLVHNELYRDIRIYLFKQIKSEYQYDNSILPPLISDDFTYCQEISLTADEETADYKIYDQENHFLLGLNFKDFTPYSRRIILVLFLLFVLIYCFVIEWIRTLYRKVDRQIKNEVLQLAFFAFDLFILRFLDYYFRFPRILKDSFLFENNVDLLAGFNSVGDLLLNSLLILFVALRAYVYYKNQRFSDTKPSSRIYMVILDVLLFLIVFGLAFLIDLSVSTLPYNPFLGVSFQGITGVLTIVSIVMLVFSLLYFGRALGRISLRYNAPLYTHFIVALITSGLAYIIFDNQGFLVIITTLLVLILWTLMYYIKESQHINFIKYLVFIVLLSATAAIVINQAILKKKNGHQQIIAERLSTSSDPVLEYKYSKFENEILEDTLFKTLLISNKPDNEISLSEYISQKYFSEFTGYNIQLTICDTDEQLEIYPEGIIIDCFEYFNSQINNIESQPNTELFYLIQGEPKSIYYIGKLEVNDQSLNATTLDIFIEFYFNFIPEGLGYPELLIDNTLFELDLSGYSYVHYQYNQLINKFGGYDYQTSYDYLKEFPDRTFFNYNGNRHFKIEFMTDEYLVVSRPIEKMSIHLVTFSSLFIIISIVLLSAFFILYGKEARKVFQMSFQTRLQMIFISTISLIIILLAIITIFYVEASNKQKLREQLTEKTNSVLIELDHKLSGEESLDNYNMLELEQLLQKFSMVFFSDINVYSPAGKLMASSRPEIFNRGLISELVNPMAFEELFVKNKLYYLTEESIGNVSYYSSYAPLILGTGQTAGMLNLPYFAKQSEVTWSYYLMIFTFINSFVILGIVGAFIAIALSRIVTRPLVVLQKNLANIQIDRQNEAIDWDSDDEIGQLITEYNHMIEKLEQSAELLKQSERESAWREVARQIAHEIKNPLTPMKLNVQYLEKAFSEDDPDLSEKVKSISATLVTQIDTLNKVAEMFSDFATSNVRNFEKVDLQKAIHQSIDLFSSNPNVTITFKTDDPENQYIILAFEKDLLRLFNNLIKNAIQSMDGKREGVITVSLESLQNSYMVKVVDNGRGIPNETKASIFQPYFTTKSAGTGLGLAIVKNIMNEIGGEINFESSPEEGTVFSLKFKAANA